MYKIQKNLMILAGFFMVVMIPNASADEVPFEGTNADDIKMTIETRQGGEWFDVRRFRADDDGVIEIEDVLPGKYRLDIDDKYQQTGQTVAAELHMLDEDGIELDDDSDVEVSVHMDGQKIVVGVVETNDDGELKLVGLQHGITYELDVKDDGDLSSKSDRPRLKAYAKIDDSDWFKAKTDYVKNGVYEMENVLPGKYKFKFKSKDRDRAPEKFIVKARLRDEDGRKIKEKTKVKIYAYPFGVRVLAAEIETDHRGWVVLPGVQADMKYKIKL